MRKITLLTVAVFAIVLAIGSLTGELSAQSDAKVKKIIKAYNTQFITSFNSGDIASLVEMYREDACLISRGCGKAFIEQYYTLESYKYKFTDITITSISVSDSIAVEKGSWSAVLNSGQTIGGEYLSEWKLRDNKWLVASESSGLSLE